MLLQGLSNPHALESGTTPVNQAHLAEASLVRCFQIRLDYTRDVARLKAVEVDGVLDLEYLNVIIGRRVRHFVLREWARGVER